MLSNELNRLHGLLLEAQYDFYYESVRRGKSWPADPQRRSISAQRKAENMVQHCFIATQRVCLVCFLRGRVAGSAHVEAL